MADLLNTFFVNYTWNIAIIHIIAAIVLFFIVNWIGAHSVSIGYIQLSIMAKEDIVLGFSANQLTVVFSQTLAQR